ncbi:MAG: 50S ribosomal protein L23 [Flavobacteriales bacterium]|nr:50S ribosomal protein L23 [Flavobacteriales bacterium]MCX7768043.1 50S ribosomal protein L23 [Flavobacteriales bacterium]MDW8409248.1 50S ribosomal protein L23 [Flavobacteriales bacterium]
MKDILLRPIITEKMTSQAEKLNRYGFFVAMDANKVEIRKAVEQRYQVQVEKVNTLRQAGKTVQRFTKRNVLSGRRPHVKKAIVTLKPGFTINFFNNI